MKIESANAYSAAVLAERSPKLPHKSFKIANNIKLNRPISINQFSPENLPETLSTLFCFITKSAFVSGESVLGSLFSTKPFLMMGVLITVRRLRKLTCQNRV